jgi:hypothetical protein
MRSSSSPLICGRRRHRDASGSSQWRRGSAKRCQLQRRWDVGHMPSSSPMSSRINIDDSACFSLGGGRSRRTKSDVDDHIVMVQWHDDASNAVVNNNVGEDRDRDNGGRNAGRCTPARWPSSHRVLERRHGGGTNKCIDDQDGRRRQGRGGSVALREARSMQCLPPFYEVFHSI